MPRESPSTREARLPGPTAGPLLTWRPRQDSNLRTRLRRPMLYPLSYEGGTAEQASGDGRAIGAQGRRFAAGPIGVLCRDRAPASRTDAALHRRDPGHHLGRDRSALRGGGPARGRAPPGADLERPRPPLRARLARAPRGVLDVRVRGVPRRRAGLAARRQPVPAERHPHPEPGHAVPAGVRVVPPLGAVRRRHAGGARCRRLDRAGRADARRSPPTGGPTRC